MGGISKANSTSTSKGLRSRTGCLTCRGRRKKCDETKPVCAGCRRNALDCVWPTASGISNSTSSSTPASAPGQGDSEGATASQSLPFFINFPLTNDLSLPPADVQNETVYFWNYSIPDVPLDRYDGLHQVFETTPPAATTTATNASHFHDGAAYQPCDPAPVQDRTVPVPASASAFGELSQPFPTDLDTILQRLEEASLSPMEPSPSCLMLIASSKSSTFLFCHYLDRTARSVAISIDDAENPLLHQLVPFALSSTTVMQALLMISAIHVSNSRPGWSALAWRYYAQVSDIIDDRMQLVGHQETDQSGFSDVEELLFVCLLLVVFQPIGGGQQPYFVKHLHKATMLLSLAREKSIYLHCESFINDAYFYNVTVGSISWATQSRSNQGAPGRRQGSSYPCHLELCSADALKRDYPGWLCGVAYQILEYVWFVADLSRRIQHDRSSMGWPTEDAFVEYQRVNALFRSWMPSPEMAARCPGYCKAAELYRFAGIIYLHRVIYPFTDCATDATIQGVLNEFFAVLASASHISEIPGALCWAVVFVGPCVTDDSRRAVLMKHLHTDYDICKMVNVGQTIKLLAKLWWIRDLEEDECQVLGPNTATNSSSTSGSGPPREAPHGRRSRCSWDFYYVMRSLERWDTFIS